MMATFAAILGVELPDDAGEDSFNILPLLQGDDDAGREMVINHTGNREYAFRRGPWKVVTALGRNGELRSPGELYDLSSDLAETRDLWDEHPEMGEELLALLGAQRAAGRTRGVS
jgi:arylsulfatase A-like enzyme